MHPARVPLALLLLAGPLCAQALPHDVPKRGALVYKRTTMAFEVNPPPSRLRPEWLVQPAEAGGHEWRTFAAPAGRTPAGFEQPGFADQDWLVGRARFHAEVDAAAGNRTAWRSAELGLRSRVDLGSRKPRALLLRIDHDDGVRVWLNGVSILQNDGYGYDRQYVVMGDPLDAWQRGENVLAAHCTNLGGAQYFDLALAVFATLPPGTRTAEDLLRQLREEREQADRLRRDLFGGYRAPPLLLQGELDAQGSSVRIPPGDLRDLGWWLATNLGPGVQGGSVGMDAFRMARLGDLQLRGRASAVDAAGWQVLEVAVKNSAEPALREDSKRHVERFVRPHVWYGFDGKLVVRRRLELRGEKGEKALVAEFTTDLQGRLLRGKDWKETAGSFAQREAWTFDSMRDNQDAAFRALVAKALQKGTSRLREQLRDLGQPDLRAEPENADRSYHGGRLAIGLLALLKGGVPKDDEVVARGLAELRRRNLVDTYSLGNALMALESVYAPPNEFGDLKQGAIDRPRKRTPPPEDQAVMKRWTAQLLNNIDTRVDPAYLLRFNYVRGERFDNSVNQYGLLGLYSAHLCGVPIPATVWEAAANHLIAAQSPGGQRLDLDLVDYRTHAARQADPEAKWTVARTIARASGWNYEGPKSEGELTPTWGSMTCAGISGLAICEAALQDYGGLKRIRLQQDMARARSDGFAWLAQHMTLRCHAGAIERQQAWFYYYLYGLERAALLSGVALIQDRDWYFEGAMVLVLAQQDDGNWPAELHWDLGIERNAMAILFLKQGTLPVLTGR
ncbi:MAG: hypothetical protein FJ265_16770 [Planctomycetes bacterium]|nr:hypothetical protein [Planctomycetota bacterium]